MQIDFVLKISSDKRTFEKFKISDEIHYQKNYKVKDNNGEQLDIETAEKLSLQEIQKNEYTIKLRNYKKYFKKVLKGDRGIVLLKEEKTKQYQVAYINIEEELSYEEVKCDEEYGDIKYKILGVTNSSLIVSEVVESLKGVQGTIIGTKKLLDSLNSKEKLNDWILGINEKRK